VIVAAPARGESRTVELNTVEEAIAYAVEHGPELQEYALRQMQAHHEYQAVRHHRQPSISGSFGAQRNTDLPVTPLPGELFGRPGETVEAEFGTDYSFTGGVTVSTSILDLEAWYTARAAEAAAEIATASVGAYRQLLTEQVAFNYYTATVTGGLLRGQKETIDAAVQALELASSRFEEGVVDRTVVNQALMNLNAARQDQLDYQDVLDQAVHALQELLGVPAETELVLSERIAVRTVVLPEPGDLGPDRGLSVDELSVTQARASWKQARASRLPKLTLNSYWGGQQYRNDAGLSFDGDEWAANRYLSISLSVPLFTGFQKRNKVRAAQASLRLAEHTLERNREASRIRDQLLRVQIQRSVERVRIARESFELSRSTSSLALQKHEQGAVSFDSYLDANEDQQRAEAIYLGALLEYYGLYATYLSREQ
jgi:outer membrane protein TolC